MGLVGYSYENKKKTNGRIGTGFWNVLSKARVHHLRRVIGEAKGLASFASAFGMMEGISSNAVDGLFCSDEEGDYFVENFMLCSFAHHVCCPLLQGFLHEEKPCKVALACPFSLDVIFLSGLRGSLILEWSLWHAAAKFSGVADLSGATAARGCESWFCLPLWSVFAHCSVLSLHQGWTATARRGL